MSFPWCLNLHNSFHSPRIYQVCTMQKQIAHRPFRNHTLSIAIISLQTRGIYRIHIWELKTTLSVICFNVLPRTGIPFIESLIYGHLASIRTLQHSCHWWRKCYGSGDMVSEVNRLLVAGIRNLTHTTHAKKNIFCHILIFGFRSGFRHFLPSGGVWLLPSGSDLTVSWSYPWINHNTTGVRNSCQIQESYPVMSSGMGSVPLNSKVWGWKKGSSQEKSG